MLKKIKHKAINTLKLLHIKVQSVSHKKKIYLLGIPLHGNIGDQAIAYAEKQFLKDYFKEYKIIEVESSITLNKINYLKKIINDSTILVHGGGFLGSLWPNEEKMFRTVLLNFPNNLIVVMPQTAYFSDDDEGKETLKESKKIYEKHKNLYILCRESYSYEFMKKNFPQCKSYLVPDMVLYLKPYISRKERSNVSLLCIRHDKEKINYEIGKIEEHLLNKGLKIKHTDTVIDRIVPTFRRKKIIYTKIKEFAEAKLIVTDRLHGMVFALISKTPCVALENKSYKIKGVYDWIKNIDFIKLTTENSIIADIDKVMESNINEEKDNIDNLFSEMAKMIKELINE